MGACSYQPIIAHITKYLTSLNGSLFVSTNHRTYYKIPYVTQWELICINQSQPILQNTLRHSMGACSYQLITAHITKCLTSLNGSLFVSANHSPDYKITFGTTRIFRRVSSACLVWLYIVYISLRLNPTYLGQVLVDECLNMSHH